MKTFYGFMASCRKSCQLVFIRRRKKKSPNTLRERAPRRRIDIASELLYYQKDKWNDVSVSTWKDGDGPRSFRQTLNAAAGSHGVYTNHCRTCLLEDLHIHCPTVLYTPASDYYSYQTTHIYCCIQHSYPTLTT